MKPSRFTLISMAVAGVQTALAGYIAMAGPEHPIPMHFNLNGAPDRWGGRDQAAMVIGLMALVSAAAAILPVLSRRADAPAGDRSISLAQAALLFVTSAVCALILVATYAGLGALTAGAGLHMAFICLLFTGLGAYLGKVGPNPLVGVRTPWTFSSRLAWDKSNRLAGRLLFWAGLAGMAAAPFAPEPQGLHAVFAGLAVIAALTVFESWRVWRADPDRAGAM